MLKGGREAVAEVGLHVDELFVFLEAVGANLVPIQVLVDDLVEVLDQLYLEVLHILHEVEDHEGLLLLQLHQLVVEHDGCQEDGDDQEEEALTVKEVQHSLSLHDKLLGLALLILLVAQLGVSNDEH